MATLRWTLKLTNNPRVESTDPAAEKLNPRGLPPPHSGLQTKLDPLLAALSARSENHKLRVVEKAPTHVSGITLHIAARIVELHLCWVGYLIAKLRPPSSPLHVTSLSSGRASLCEKA